MKYIFEIFEIFGKKLSQLEVQLKELEQNLSNDEAKEPYNARRDEINEIYDEISNGIKIKSKCDWYEFGEKSNKFFRKTSSNKKYTLQGTII